MRAWRFLIIQVGPNISNMRISQADNLSRVTRIGENFLIPGEAGIENDFAAAPGDRSPRAPMKNAPIFERKNSPPCFRFRQWTLSSAFALKRLQRTYPPSFGTADLSAIIRELRRARASRLGRSCILNRAISRASTP